VVMGGLGIFLLIRSANERSLLLANFIDWIANHRNKPDDPTGKMNTPDQTCSPGQR
jgi:hypothetical protein